MIIDCISDLHGHCPRLEGGDLLIVAGDLFKNNDLESNILFLAWLETQDYKNIVFVSGNHDNLLFSSGYPSTDKIKYLCDSGTEFDGLKIWGSPWTKRFEGMNPHCMAFTCATEEELEEKWALIPDDTDILVTHSPAWMYLDETENGGNAGSISLYHRLVAVKPKVHVFGHIHEAHGMFRPSLDFINCPGYPIFVNASHVNELYEPANKPIRIEL